MDGSDEDERLAVRRMVFIIFGEASIIGKPAKGSFHDPALGQDFEGVERMAFNHLQAQTAAGKQSLEPLAESFAGITSIDPDQAQPAKRRRELPQHQARAVAILNVGRVNHHRQNQTQRIHQEMSLSSHDLFARIVAAHSSVVRYLNALAVEDRSGRGFFFPLLSRTASRKES